MQHPATCRRRLHGASMHGPGQLGFEARKKTAGGALQRGSRNTLAVPAGRSRRERFGCLRAMKKRRIALRFQALLALPRTSHNAIQTGSESPGGRGKARLKAGIKFMFRRAPRKRVWKNTEG